MIYFKDISYAQGQYDMGSNSDPMVMMKVSGAYTVSKGLYYDSQATRNYTNATEAGKVPFMYHFAGGGDPIAEADWFVSACSPLAPGDGMALDWEIEHDSPVAWCQAFLTHVHDRTGVWPWIYMDIDRANRFDWSPVLVNCGLWIAAPSFSFDDNIPVRYVVMAQQGPIENGVDTNAFFGSIDQAKKYTFGQPAPQPEPTPAPQPTPDPVPVPEPTPSPAPQPDPVPTPSPTPTPVPTPSPINPSPVKNPVSLYDWLVNIIKLIIPWLKTWVK